MSKAAEARQSPEPEAARGFVFGTAHRPRRRAAVASKQTVSDADLIAAFLKTNKVKVIDAAYADGAVKTSGSYEW